MNESEALQMLASRPLEFLRKNSLTPYTVPGGSRVCTFYMKEHGTIQRPGSRLGNLNPHEGQRFQARPGPEMGGTPFQAVNIAVQPSNIAINPLPLHTVGCNLMLTTQLSGCCIVMIPGGGTFSVAHLQPTGETGADLRRRLSGLGMKVYGATDYAGGRAVVVGARIGGTWGFYAQTQDGNFNVTSARQLTT